MNKEQLAALRNDYSQAGIDPDSLPDNPFSQFSLWFDQAVEAEIAEPNGMVIAVCGDDGVPSQRTVLMKFFDSTGFYFYTNYGSRKARILSQNAAISCHFPWLSLHRQVAFEGRVVKAEVGNSAAYFATRPRASQIGAHASRQSEVLANRATLEQRIDELEQQFQGQEVPLPEFWGGYQVIPHRVEFWQGRSSRLHDRFVYTLDSDTASGEQSSWSIKQLYP